MKRCAPASPAVRLAGRPVRDEQPAACLAAAGLPDGGPTRSAAERIAGCGGGAGALLQRDGDVVHVAAEAIEDISAPLDEIVALGGPVEAGPRRSG